MLQQYWVGRNNISLVIREIEMYENNNKQSLIRN